MVLTNVGPFHWKCEFIEATFQAVLL
uniref:Uncharacterized protein n=1 Tax=Arundo donax TaxID=35708 RepID=A0A0A9GQ70_ARUDO